AVAMTDGEGAGLLHLFQRAFQTLRPSRCGYAGEQSSRYDDPACSLHAAPPLSFDGHVPRPTAHWVRTAAASMPSPRRSTITSTAPASMMNGGASKMWSPRTPSAVPPMG